MRVPYQDCFHLIEPLLAKVEKPSRYIDHEWGTLSKADADYRCCMIYPDVYEVGLPNQGIAILYNILNQAEGISCERGYVPWPDMGDAMREAGIPLLSLEGAAPVASFDIVGMHVPHEMAVTNFLEALDLAGIPLLAADRTEGDPIIVAGGLQARRRGLWRYQSAVAVVRALRAARSRPPVDRDSARLCPRLPFLPGRHDLSSGARALGRPDRVFGDSGSGKDRL